MGLSTDHSHSSADHRDPCGDFGPTQRWALVWFCAVIAIGASVSYTLCQIDSTMYATNAEFFDYAKYKDNRYSAIRIKGDGYDERAHATVTDAKRALLALNEVAPPKAAPAVDHAAPEAVPADATGAEASAPEAAAPVAAENTEAPAAPHEEAAAPAAPVH